MSKTVRMLEFSSEWLNVILFAVLPLFFLPLTQDFYDFNKWSLLVSLILVIFILWLIKSMLSGNFTIVISPLTAAFGSLAIAGLASTFLTSVNIVEALISPLGPLTYLALTLISLLTNFNPQKKTQLRWTIIFTTAILGLLAIYQFLGFGKTLFPNSFVADPGWTPVGSATALAAILAMFIPLHLSTFIQQIKHKKETGVIVSGIFLLILITGLTMTFINLIPKLATILLPFWAAWQITLEVFKKLPQALWGTGPGNYLTAFTLGRPAALNSGPLWAVRFVVGPSLFFETVTTLGVAGLSGLLLLVRSILIPLKNKAADFGLAGSLVLAILMIIFVPPTLTLLIATTSLLLLIDDHKAKLLNFHLKSKYLWLLTIPGVLLLTAIALYYPLIRIYAAETVFYRAALAAAANNGTQTYNDNITAIQLNPKITAYHLRLSQTSLTLASAIVNQKTQGSPSATLNDADRSTVTQLVQQAISEAKNATALSPKSVVVWQNLATTYESLQKIAQGADQWTIAAYQQAIQLDPTNPILRVRLGGAYLTLNRLDEAAAQFQLAAQLKPDYANARYNLAYVFRKQQKNLNAALELTALSALVQSGSDDEKKVTSELTEVKKLLNKDELDYLTSPASLLPPPQK